MWPKETEVWRYPSAPRGEKNIYKCGSKAAYENGEVPSYTMNMTKQPHVLAIAYPAQGHIGPLMKLSHWIADTGIKVTFVLGQSVHARVLASMPEKGEEQTRIEIVSIPDGVESLGDDQKLDSILRVMPGHLEDLIKNINLSDNEQITCVIADVCVGWALETAEKMGIKRAAFWPTTVAGFVLANHIPMLIENGIINDSGFVKENCMTQLSPNIPSISTTEFIWSCPGNPIKQNDVFRIILPTNKTLKISNWVLCNSFYELDPSACDLIPNLLPVGPLPSSNSLGQSAGNFWPQDTTCLSWLDQKPARSVIYVAFGSTAMFNQGQFEEIALGLQLLGQPFLWVVRTDTIKESIIKYPDGFLNEIAKYGMIVEWAPQAKVLAHPSVGCFLTHCGWNSTMEGISTGVPFLCWPYFTDQFQNQKYICDVWKVGLGLNQEEECGIISRYEIKKKLEELLSDAVIRTNALKLKEMAKKSAGEGGSSSNNFKNFIQQLKCC